MKSVRIRNFSGLYFSAFGLNTDQKDSEYGHFSRSGAPLKGFEKLTFMFIHFVRSLALHPRNPSHPSVVFHIETNHSICNAI